MIFNIFCLFFVSRLREDDNNNEDGKTVVRELGDYKAGEKLLCFVKSVSCCLVCILRDIFFRHSFVTQWNVAQSNS